MPFDLLAPFGDDAFLGLQLLGLLGQAGRRGVDLAGLLIHLGLAPFQTRLTLGQRTSHFGKLPLPLNELLAESSNGQAVFLAGAMEHLLLFSDLSRFDLHLGSQRFDGFLTLMGVGVQFLHMVAELFAGLR